MIIMIMMIMIKHISYTAIMLYPLQPRLGAVNHRRHRLNGYFAQRVPSLSLASSFYDVCKS